MFQFKMLNHFVNNFARLQINSIIKKSILTISRARTQAAEVRIISSSSSISLDNLDESLPCLVYNDDDDTPDCESSNQQSSLFSEINSLVCLHRFEIQREREKNLSFKETMSNETIKKCLNGTNNDIELDLLLAKNTTLSSSLSILNQLVSY